MAKLKLYRYTNTGTMCLQLTNGNGKVSRHSLPITLEPNQWDGKQVTAAHPNRAELNAYLTNTLSEAQLILSRIQKSQPTASMPPVRLLELVTAELFQEEEKEPEKQPSTFSDVWEAFVDTKTNQRTKDIYNITLKRIREYDARVLTLEMITRRWLEGFDKWLAKRSPAVNARGIHMRNIRAVFNYALDEELTEFYPFRRNGFKIKREETIHRDLTPEDLRLLFSYQPPTVRNSPKHTKPLDYAVKYVDMAKLMFFLIGINPVDLFRAKPQDYYGGRINYRRAKTHAVYGIKVEPEAAAILKKYRGEKLLISFAEGRDYRSVSKLVNKALRSISKDMGLPPVTMYWMRHSWSTIAYTLGASYDMVSDCLGHKHGATVTATYINKRRVFHSKDELNRAVIDFVLYGKEECEQL